MNNTLRKSTGWLPLALGLLLTAPSASAHEVYAKAGFPGVGAGYALGMNKYFGVRADYSSVGAVNRSGVAGMMRYDAELKASQLGAYADWFPFGGRFRLSGGLHSRTLELVADGTAENGMISIGELPAIPLGKDDSVQARVEWPKVAPYLGIGWGHQAERNRGFGFVADLGVSFGSPKIELTLSSSLRAQLDKVSSKTNLSVDDEIERQRRDIADDVETVKVFPHLFVGVSYRF